MFAQLAKRYAADLDAALRQVIATIPETPGFNVMLRYPFGWVDENDRPHQQPAGKRIRPLLLLLCAEAAGGDWRTALPAAAAIETLHNFSLLHDDIQDDSPTRHGRPTVWMLWGRPNAINAGDALFALAYCALERLSGTYLSADTILKVWRIFSTTVLELTRGQHLDMRYEKQALVTVDDYFSMISGKSAALVSASAQMGALIASGDEETARRYAEFGYNLGVGFQIRDDILGIWGDESVTGKSAATDILSRKKTLPVLYGLSQSDELAAIYHRESFGESDVEEAVNLLDTLGAQAYAYECEGRYYGQALEALELARPQGEAANWLQELTDTLFQRNA